MSIIKANTIENLGGDESHDVATMGIESGSNANGDWTKFPDGTLICTHEIIVPDTNVAVGSMYESAAVIWTFPMPFVGNSPTTIGSTTSASLYCNCATMGDNALVSSNIKNYSARNIWAADNVRVTAIGRWK